MIVYEVDSSLSNEYTVYAAITPSGPDRYHIGSVVICLVSFPSGEDIFDVCLCINTKGKSVSFID